MCPNISFLPPPPIRKKKQKTKNIFVWNVLAARVSDSTRIYTMYNSGLRSGCSGLRQRWKSSLDARRRQGNMHVFRWEMMQDIFILLYGIFYYGFSSLCGFICIFFFFFFLPDEKTLEQDSNFKNSNISHTVSRVVIISMIIKEKNICYYHSTFTHINNASNDNETLRKAS